MVHFIPVSLRRKTAADAVQNLVALRREFPGRPLVAIQPADAPREVAAIAAEHADAVFHVGGDYIAALKQAGIPNPERFIVRGKYAPEESTEVGARLLSLVQPYLTSDADLTRVLVRSAAIAWNAAFLTNDEQHHQLRERARELAPGYGEGEAVDLMLGLFNRRCMHYTDDNRLILDVEMDVEGESLRVHPLVAEGVAELDRDLREAIDALAEAKALTEPFAAFVRDGQALRVEEDETRLSVRWLAAAQVAHRLRDGTASEQKQLVAIWVKQTRDAQREAEGGGAWTALSMPGIVVRDLSSAAETLIAFSTEALAGGALYLAYCIATGTRIALLDRGPARVRARATLVQADVLRAMRRPQDALDTYEAALEDAVRARDQALMASLRTRIKENGQAK